MGGSASEILGVLYAIIDLGTFVYLIVDDARDHGPWWHWLIFVPIDIFQAQIWPIYWAFLHWVT